MFFWPRRKKGKNRVRISWDLNGMPKGVPPHWCFCFGFTHPNGVHFLYSSGVWSPSPREELIVITDSEKTAVFCCRLILRNSWRILWRVGSMVANVCSSSVKQISIKHDRSQYCTGSWTWFVQMSLPYDSYNKTFCTSWLRCSATLERRRSPTFPEDHRENQTWCSTFRWIAPKKNDLQKPKISLVSLECSRQVSEQFKKYLTKDHFSRLTPVNPHLQSQGLVLTVQSPPATEGGCTGLISGMDNTCSSNGLSGRKPAELLGWFCPKPGCYSPPPVSLLGWMQFLIFTHLGFTYFGGELQLNSQGRLKSVVTQIVGVA